MMGRGTVPFLKPGSEISSGLLLYSTDGESRRMLDALPGEVQVWLQLRPRHTFLPERPHGRGVGGCFFRHHCHARARFLHLGADHKKHHREVRLARWWYPPAGTGKATAGRSGGLG